MLKEKMNQWLLAALIVVRARGNVTPTTKVRHQTVLLGSNVTITCTNVNLLTRTVCWYRVENAFECSNKNQIYSGEKIYPQLRGRYSVVNNSSGRQLTIASAQFNDTGLICCIYCKFPDNGSITQLDVIDFDENYTISYGSLSTHEDRSNASMVPLEAITTTVKVQYNSGIKTALFGSVSIWISIIFIVSILLIKRCCLTHSASDPHTVVDRTHNNDEDHVATPERYHLHSQQTQLQLQETINGVTYALVLPRRERGRNTESNVTGMELQPETATNDNTNYTIDYTVDYVELSTAQRQTPATTDSQRVDPLATYVRIDHSFKNVV